MFNPDCKINHTGNKILVYTASLLAGVVVLKILSVFLKDAAQKLYFEGNSG